MNRVNVLSILSVVIFFAGYFSVSASTFQDQITLIDSTKLEGKIYSVVSEAPRFPGCSAGGTKAIRSECATTKMLKFIYGNIKYPEAARENGVQGSSVIGFVVAKDGSLHNFKIIRSIGSGCDEEALRVVQSMPKWDPGIQEGQAVNVQFNLPVKFVLHGSSLKEDKKAKKNRKNKG